MVRKRSPKWLHDIFTLNFTPGHSSTGSLALFSTKGNLSSTMNKLHSLLLLLFSLCRTFGKEEISFSSPYHHHHHQIESSARFLINRKPCCPRLKKTSQTYTFISILHHTPPRRPRNKSHSIKCWECVPMRVRISLQIYFEYVADPSYKSFMG